MQRGLRPGGTEIIKRIKGIRKNGIFIRNAEPTGVTRAFTSKRIVEGLALGPKRTSLALTPRNGRSRGSELKLQ